MKYISSIKNEVGRNLTNVLGYKNNQKYLVIESDDWGTIRMASREAFDNLKKLNYPIENCPYNRHDALESNEDLECLLETLNSVKGGDGKPAKFTINNIVANPDFKKIADSNFKDYHYESFVKTLSRYPKHDKVMQLYKEGIDNGLVQPQFHGREHLNVNRWMTALSTNKLAEKDGFKNSVFSFHSINNSKYFNEYMDALDLDNLNQLDVQKKSLIEGLDLFENIWGFRSKSFIAPCYIWSKELELTLANQGIKYIQGIINQFQPTEGPEYKYKKIKHYLGQKNKNQQYYLVRNVFFEPCIQPNFNWEKDCLNRIEIAFKWKKPAVLSSHRLNYIGFLNPENRTVNLQRLKALLDTILKKWPDVQFISSDELGDLMNKEN